MFQRVLARVRHLKLAPDKSNNSAPDENLARDETTEDYSSEYFEIPPEVQEKIISEIQNPKVLLAVRLVSHFWNEIAAKLLELRHLSHWTTWYPSPRARVISVAPSVVEVFKSSKRGLTHLKLPMLLHKNYHIEGNPFPTKSISIFGEKCFLQHKSKMSSTFTTKWKKFFIRFGDCLSSIILHRVDITTPQIILLLSHAPALKALKMYHVRSVRNSEMQLQKNVVSQCLQHLQFLHVDENIVDLILSTCDHQLVSLTLVCVAMSVLCERNFDKLKQLKVYENMSALFWDVRISSDLQCLSVILDDVHRTQEQNFHLVANFLCQFSSSLTYLHLNVSSEHLLEHLEKNQIVCGNLKSLSIQEVGIETHSQQIRQELFRKHNALLDQAFPKLEYINFTSLINREEY